MKDDKHLLRDEVLEKIGHDPDLDKPEYRRILANCQDDAFIWILEAFDAGEIGDIMEWLDGKIDGDK